MIHNAINVLHQIYANTVMPIEKVILKRKWIEDTIVVDYEDLSIKIPRDYDEYLRLMYGDYMTPPPLHQQKSQHYHYFVDLDRRLSIEEIKEIKRHVK